MSTPSAFSHVYINWQFKDNEMKKMPKLLFFKVIFSKKKIIIKRQIYNIIKNLKFRRFNP